MWTHIKSKNIALFLIFLYFVAEFHSFSRKMGKKRGRRLLFSFLQNRNKRKQLSFFRFLVFVPSFRESGSKVASKDTFKCCSINY